MDTQNKLASDDVFRIAMTGIGALSGVAGWLFIDVLRDLVTNQHLYLFLFAFVMGAFAVILALAGPQHLRRAIPAGVALSLVSAVLLWMAALGFSELDAFFSSGTYFAAYGLLMIVGTPFVAAALCGQGEWRNYKLLFDRTWTIVVRYCAALVFVGLAWAILFLSDALFKIVDIQVLNRLMDVDWFPYVFSGAGFGLALAVVHELRDYISPHLVLRLLRLLLPAVLIVVAVFVVALPFRGLSGLFGGFSAAGTLMAMAFAVITLITVALDRDSSEEVQITLMRWSVKALCGLLPILTIIALYAVVIRVGQYGWTPHRLAAFVAAFVMVIYAVAYFVSIIKGGAWSARIRAANIVMALVAVGTAVLWLSPFPNPESISVRNQLARFEAGQTPLTELPLWQFKDEWGHSGEAALERLSSMTAHLEYTDIQTRLAELENSNNKWQFQSGANAISERENAATIVELLKVLPQGEINVGPEMLNGWDARKLRQYAASCSRETVAGTGCVLVLGQFDPGFSGKHGVVILANPNGNVTVEPAHLEDGKLVVSGQIHTIGPNAYSLSMTDVFSKLDAGEFRIEPVHRNGLIVGDTTFIPNN